MKKLIASKKCTFSCGCPRDDELRKTGRSRKPKKHTKQPKAVIHPVWTVRNDSSNVSAILHPDDYQQSPRNAYTVSSKAYKGQQDKYKGVFKKCCLAGNTCYCREQKKIKPTLISRPNTCLSVDSLGRDLPKEEFKSCLCKDSELIRRYQEDFGDRCSCLKYSQQRNDYEDFREEQDEGKDESVATLLGTQIADTQTVSSDLDDLSKFRKEHYFDTHSTNDLSKDVPDHTCVHQYKLDDRLLPEPTNVDSYGRSRCLVCSCPKEGSVPTTDTYRDVSISDDDSRVELKLNKKDLERFGGFMGRFRRPQHFNTLALRQQKMLHHKMQYSSNFSASDVYY